ncbi:SPARK domain-containing protein [Psidium guajava]|nr:SPARK domain-containing protein [Psidium guajava]
MDDKDCPGAGPLRLRHRWRMWKADFLFAGVVGRHGQGKGEFGAVQSDREKCPVAPSQPNQTYVEFALPTPYHQLGDAERWRR